MFKNRIFKFIDIEDQYNLNNIKNDELLCKFFDSFNDPYEGHFGVSSIWPDPCRESEKLRSLISRLSPEGAEINTASIESMIQYIKTNNHLQEFTRKFLYRETEKYRICSFTRRWNHILMWSHYSKGGSGATLVFDERVVGNNGWARRPGIEEELKGIALPLKWVVYKKKPPVINAVEVFELVKVASEKLREKVSNEIFEKCIFTKYETWRYEQESRLVVRIDDEIARDSILYKYPKGALKGIIIGNKCSEESYRILADSVNDSVVFYLAKQSSHRYKYEISGSFLAGDIRSEKVEIRKMLE